MLPLAGRMSRLKQDEVLEISGYDGRIEKGQVFKPGQNACRRREIGGKLDPTLERKDRHEPQEYTPESQDNLNAPPSLAFSKL
uniref:ORF82 n=1 Tax=Leptospirillum ferrooxidans TaxID=180 RepID=Q58KG9_9BACT|nr:hypothetical protein [Leptospirillum ferrooxidans]AAX36033.1 ORF82 [Leptospirillum ferrooxidans]